MERPSGKIDLSKISIKWEMIEVMEDGRPRCWRDKKFHHMESWIVIDFEDFYYDPYDEEMLDYDMLFGD